MPPLALVVALAQNGVLGRAGGLPWDYPEDRRHFLDVTRGHAVLMGRRTFEETGRALPDRRNIVVSRTLAAAPDVEIAATLDEAISLARETDPEPFVIGGVRLFEEALPRVTRLLLTEIPGEPEGDTVWHLDRTGFRAVSERRGERGLVFLELLRDGVTIG